MFHSSRAQARGLRGLGRHLRGSPKTGPRSHTGGPGIQSDVQRSDPRTGTMPSGVGVLRGPLGGFPPCGLRAQGFPPRATRPSATGRRRECGLALPPHARSRRIATVARDDNGLPYVFTPPDGVGFDVRCGGYRGPADVRAQRQNPHTSSPACYPLGMAGARYQTQRTALSASAATHAG